MNNQPTAEQALSFLDQATQPANISKLTRADFANIEVCLQMLKKAHAPKPNPAKEG